MRLPENHPARDAWWQQQQEWYLQDREFHRHSAGAPDDVWSSWEHEVSQRPKTREEWETKRRQTKSDFFAKLYDVEAKVSKLEPTEYSGRLRGGYHNTHRNHVHFALPNVAESLDPIKYSTRPGFLYHAPAGTDMYSRGWKPLGYTTEGAKVSFNLTDIDPTSLRAAFGGGTLTTSKTNANELREAEKMLNDFTATPEQLENAAVRMAAQAEAIRKFDETEPEGAEPTISFRHRYQSGGYSTNYKTYTFVAFKAADGKWYLTGRETRGYSWRELGATYKAVAEGRFWVATGWDWQGENEPEGIDADETD